MYFDNTNRSVCTFEIGLKEGYYRHTPLGYHNKKKSERAVKTFQLNCKHIKR